MDRVEKKRIEKGIEKKLKEEAKKEEKFGRNDEMK